MRTKPLISLAAALALAVALPACGNEDEPATGGTTQEQTTEGAPSGDASQEVQAAIESCKASVRDQPQLSDEVKADLEEVCDEAASGDPEDAKKATREVCTRIVEETVPEGPARDQATETCKTATE